MKKFSIIFIQEVHSSAGTEKLWAIEWGYTAIFSSCSSSRGGVSVLFNNNFQFEILKQHCDPEGRVIIVDIKTNDRTLTLVNLYALNKDEPEFFQKVIEHILDFACDDIIIGGDFNAVLDVNKDKKGGNPTTHHKSVQKINEIIDKYMERYAPG